MKRILASILAVMLLPMSALPVFGAEGVLGKNIKIINTMAAWE